ncbi:hypothetical protein RB195_016705 [Necator americanus]
MFATTNFLYQYIQLCKSHLLHHPPYVLRSVCVVINFLCVANWMAMIYFCLWPSDEYLSVIDEIWPNKSSSIAMTSYIGISNRDRVDPFKTALLIESLVLLLSLAQVNPYCAMKIHTCLKMNALSLQTKKIHRQMLKLLTVQTACPTLLMHLPLGTMYLLLFAGITSPIVMSFIIGVLMATFPLSVPIIIIVSMKEYRQFFLVKLKLVEPVISSTAAVSFASRNAILNPWKTTTK